MHWENRLEQCQLWKIIDWHCQMFLFAHSEVHSISWTNFMYILSKSWWNGMERAWQGDFHYRYSLISYCYSRSNIRGTEQLSGKVYADHTYISVPVKERSKEKKRGLSKNLRQVAVAIDDSGKILAVLGGKGNASSGDSEAAFASHVSPNSIVIHDEGHFGRAFSDSTEMAVNSKGKESHAMLNPVDRVCNSVQRLFKVHLRIHPENIQNI